VLRIQRSDQFMIS